MVQVADILREHLVVEGAPLGEIGVLGADPGVHVAENVFQIGDAVARGLHGVVAQILRLRTGIDRAAELLLAETVDRIGGGPGYPFRSDGIFVGSRRSVGHGRVEPFHGIVVVEAETRRGELHAALPIPGPGHVVEASVVHDRGGRAVLLRERRRAERIDRNHRRGAHVVHVTQAMADLVGHDVAQSVADHLLGNRHGAHALVGLRRLDEQPVVQQFHHVVVDIDRSVEYLAAARIDPRRPHGVGDGDRRVANARILDVVGIEFGIVLRIGLCGDGVFKSDAPERLVPLIDGLENMLFPHLRESVVNVENDLFLRRDPLAALPGIHVRRLQPPAVGVVDHLGTLLALAEKHLAGREHRHAAVGDARTVRLAGQQHQRTGHHGRQRLVLDQRRAAAGERENIAQRTAHHHIVAESLDFAQHRTLLLKGLLQLESRIKSVLREGRHLLHVGHEQVRDVDHHGRAVPVPGLDLVIAQDGIGRVPLHRLSQRAGSPRLVGDVLAVDRTQLDRTVVARENHVQRIVRLGAGRRRSVVRNLRNGRSEQHFAPEKRIGNLEIELPLDVVQAEHAVGHRMFLLEEFVVIAFLRFFGRTLRLLRSGGFGLLRRRRRRREAEQQHQ